jgi:hypothetical protein
VLHHPDVATHHHIEHHRHANVIRHAQLGHPLILDRARRPLNYEIVWDLLWAPVAIADLTDLNPNVLYELGIRHALTAARGTTRTIMIQDETSFRLPFDFANYAVLKYRKGKVDTWKRDIRDRLRSCIEAVQYRDNPVSMTLAQHGWSFQP